ncbi:MAG TPA: CDP-diacylglycerol--glycerol-3-phosphate 3-phosphatidyltransferase [Galbitalea sp.]|jgi:CDP-diacylglycerol--glycerol-3-phosphate 3-phosphatidyltransferase|nr:CDP-diacylglycerol--glycerol-3-phosphate 3-phosphatidyltransferase [Galbitalea sp.]
MAPAPPQDHTVSPRERNDAGRRADAVIESMRGRVTSPGDTKASNGNIANIVTVIRILLVPVFIWLLFIDNGADVIWRSVATALFILAIATDGVDGHLARGRNLITNVGIILDPIADKLLVGGALVSLSILGDLWWWVTIVILVRELGITAFRFAVIRKRVIPASKGGKLKTVFQSIAISLFLAPLQLLFHDVFKAPAGVVTAINWFDWIVMGIAIVLTVYTGLDYLWQAWKLRKTEAAGAVS